MRVLGLVMMCVVSVGCSSGGSADAGDGGDANVPNIVGSCMNHDVMNGTTCEDYIGYASTDLLAQMNGCGAHSGTWSTSGCSHGMAVGACSVANSHGSIASWYYMDARWTVDAAQADCMAQGGTFVMP